MTTDPSAGQTPILTVSDLTSFLRGVVEECFPDVHVAGEVTNVTHAASGHLYFTLKDDDAQIKGVMWRTHAQRLRFRLTDGLRVVARGGLEVYPPRGQYQLVCQSLLPQGEGALELALRQLQTRLEAEGLFAPERKRSLPRYPRRIALVTSPHGAAVHDMVQVLTRRWPLADVVIIPVAVQGEGAAEQIAIGLELAGVLEGVDVVITGRGGGSIEDLWAFNEEMVVRAIAACPVPVVSAIGHEIDVTLADLAADRRALTPSEAAELVVPSRDELREQLAGLQRRLEQGLSQLSVRARLALESIAKRRCWTRPFDRVREEQSRLDDLQQRLVRGVRRVHDRDRQRLENLAAQLHALSPLAVLGRGYSLTKSLIDDRLVRSASQVRPGDQLSTLLTDGEIISRVEEIHRDDVIRDVE